MYRLLNTHDNSTVVQYYTCTCKLLKSHYSSLITLQQEKVRQREPLLVLQSVPSFSETNCNFISKKF